MCIIKKINFVTFVGKKEALHTAYTLLGSGSEYRTRAIISRGLYTFYPLFEVHLCTVTFGLMYGL